MAAPIVHSRAGLGDRRLVALTFDDGPGSITDALLDLLARHGAHATFFVLGSSIAGREEALSRTVAEGHELGNHTFSHPRPARLGDAELRAELVRTSGLVEETTGVLLHLARPPYGHEPERFAAIAAEVGLSQTVLWSLDALDWREDDPAAIVERVLAGIGPGAIVDLHDGSPAHRDEQDARPTVDAVAELLRTLAADGYRFVTVSELLEA
jgi:peptidoglycan/xylan/chitin deacetylase (PgdA/CDA1 family)